MDHEKLKEKIEELEQRISLVESLFTDEHDLFTIDPLLDTLSWNEQVILKTLCYAFPRAVSRAGMQEMLFGNNTEKYKGLDVYIHKIKHKLQNLNIVIVRTGCYGDRKLFIHGNSSIIEQIKQSLKD